MADTGSLWSFFGNDPSSGGGANYPALEARRRIALQLIAQGGKKGYPKTIGEGLTSIGDAIGDIGTMRALQRQEDAYQKYLEKTAATMPGFGASQPSVAPRADIGGGPTVADLSPAEQDAALPISSPKEEEPAPAQQAKAEPVPLPPPPPSFVPPPSRYPTTQVSMPQQRPVTMDPASQAGQAAGTEFQRPDMISPNRPVTSIAPWLTQAATYGTPAAQPFNPARAAPPVRSDAGEGYSYPPTASLQQGGVQSDAMPVGISPRAMPAASPSRDPIARLLLNGMPSAPGVPQRNPTLPGAMPPPVSAAPSPSPPGLGGPPPDRRLAQAATGTVTDIAPAPPIIPRAPLTNLPQRPTPSPVTTTQPAQPALPGDTPMSLPEAQARRMQMLNPGDPNIKAMTDQVIAVESAKRAQQDAQNMRQYENRMQLYREQATQRETFERGAPERELTRKAAEAELAQKTAFGGISQEELFKPIAKSAEEVKTIPMAQTAIRNARQAAVEGKMFTGSQAEVQLSLKKLMAAANFPSDPRIPATEEFRAFVAPVLAAARQALVGGANISDSDMKIARQAVGGEITLDRNSIVGILGSLERMNTAMAANHQRKLESVAGDDPQRQSALFGVYGLPMENVVPREAVGLLKSQPTPEVINQFNKKYHTPGLAQRILGGG